jgi:hypothetical protein
LSPYTVGVTKFQEAIHRQLANITLRGTRLFKTCLNEATFEEAVEAVVVTVEVGGAEDEEARPAETNRKRGRRRKTSST